MARRARTEASDPHDEIVDWYRRRLSGPARSPDADLTGPTWQTEDGRWWLPDRTLGWDVLAWCGRWLQHSRGQPWRFTDEQARWILWWYAVDEDGQFTYRDGVLQRVKGWGKDPVGACVSAVEMLGPARVADVDGTGVLAVDVPEAWVQIAAVSLEQTKNTMRLFPQLFTDEAKQRYGLQVGKEMVHALGDTRLIQAVTSSPATLEGARSTFVLRNETHLWLSSNEGHEMDAVIDRNITKSADGAARVLSITNAWDPAEDSVAQRTREAYDAIVEGRSRASGILYDSLAAPADAPLDDPAGTVETVRGDSWWLDVDRVVQAILDPRNPPSRSRRFWFNQSTATEDAWLAPHEWDRLADATKVVADGEQITLAFDGSKSDDHCALIGCRISDGHLFTVDVWDPEAHGGEAPRSEIDGTIRQTFDRFDVVGFYADVHPWESYIDQWERDLAEDLCVKATRTGGPIGWDMRSRTKKFTHAAEAFHTTVVEEQVTHDGDSQLSSHVHHARRRPNRWGVSIGKEHRESSRKIDAAVTAVLARLARTDYLALPESKQRTVKTGRAAFY